MNNEIKEILEYLSDNNKSFIICGVSYYKISDYKTKVLLDYITNLQEDYERLKEQNNDLRKIYRNTYQRLFDNGNDELASYFQAQIDDCPTFYVEPIIDYYKEWKDYKSRNEKAIEKIKKIQENAIKYSADHDTIICQDLINILQGEDDK